MNILKQIQNAGLPAAGHDPNLLGYSEFDHSGAMPGGQSPTDQNAVSL